MNRHMVALHRRLGAFGVAAIALTAIAVWGEVIECPRIERETRDIQHQIQRPPSTRNVMDTTPHPEASLTALHARLPNDGQEQSEFSQLLSRGRSAGLIFDAVRYESRAEDVRGVSRNDMILSVKGPYATLRDWMLSALERNPALDIGTLALKRSNVASNEVQGQMVLRLWTTAIARMHVAGHE